MIYRLTWQVAHGIAGSMPARKAKKVGGRREGSGRKPGRIRTSKSINLHPLQWQMIDDMRGGVTRSRAIGALIMEAEKQGWKVGVLP